MSSSTNQYFSAICGKYNYDCTAMLDNVFFLVNILSLGAGASISWTSPYMPLLQSIQSPFKEPISASQASWIGSLLAIGALIGSFFFGWLSEKFGRFWSLISAAIPQIVSFKKEPTFSQTTYFSFGGSSSFTAQLRSCSLLDDSQQEFQLAAASH